MLFKMRKKTILIFLLFIISVVLISCDFKKESNIALVNAEVENSFDKEGFSDETLNHYLIEATLDSEKSIINAAQMVTYTNREDLDLEEVHFHIYPNAFDEEDFKRYDPGGKKKSQYGYLNVKSVKVNGEKVEYSNDEVDTVLKITYDKQFKRGETYSISLVYEISMVSSFGRFGGADGTYNICNWYPVLAVYDDSGWNLDPYYNIGDPFYSEASNYDISFEVEKDFVVASSGYAYEIKTGNDKKVYEFRGDRIRDFAIAASVDFSVVFEKVNDTMVQMYYPKDSFATDVIMDSFVHTMNAVYLFSDKIGEYPYKTYSVVITDFTGAMEYPSFALISSKFITLNSWKLKDLIIHETAHQWFYGILGNDEVDEAWIDEGLASYMSSYYSLQEKEIYYDQEVSRYKWALENFGGSESVDMTKSLNDYEDWDEYRVSVYSKSFLLFNDLHERYGEDLFIKFLKELYNEHKYGVMSKNDIVNAAKSVMGENVESVFEFWLK